MKRDLLYASPACGSMIVEMACALAAYPIDIIDLDWGPNGVDDPGLRGINPLSQVPTLVMANGDIITESAAIIMFLADRYPNSELAPFPEHRDRARFLRWLMFINASIYPTFTYGDFPAKWAGEAGAVQLKETTCQRRLDNYRLLEANCVGPFFLGNTMSAIDVYIFAFSTWSPQDFWESNEVPKLKAIAAKVRQNVLLKATLARNGISD